MMQPFAFPFNTITDGSTVPSPAIVTTSVACFVLFIDVLMLMVFFNDLKHALGVHRKIDWCLVHV